ncbi:CaiB/BaiF CoA-transferase family protein [Pseudonocardia xishanensis]|uniref:CaiB/BaiF CoA-transferase family protein n=1 Tax=Pseudonocardia xishanensis TaxID=630995 RepID=A0ABP8RTI3_9PSEU
MVELGTWIAAPVASALLADLGADVVKVEPPAGDPARRWFAAMGVADGDDEVQPTFALDNRRKRSIELDLTDPTARAELDGLLGEADVMVTNMRPGRAGELGLGPAELVEAHPRLVVATVTAAGSRGKEADERGYDVGHFWARSGLAHQLGVTAPLHAPGGYGDHVTGLALFAAILAGLHERQVTGRGGVVETSLLRVGSWVASPDLAVLGTLGRVRAVPAREAAPTPLVNSYRTADDRWFFLTCIEAMRHLARVCEAVDRPELLADPRFADARSLNRHRRELIAELDAAFAAEPLSYWAERFRTTGVWWQRVQTPAEVLVDDQLVEDGALEPVDVGGGTTVPMLTSPVSVFGHREPGTARAPALDDYRTTQSSRPTAATPPQQDDPLWSTVAPTRRQAP